MPGEDEDLDFEEEDLGENQSEEAGTDSAEKPGVERDGKPQDAAGYDADAQADGEASAASQEVSRGERRFQRLANEARQAREEAARTRAELDRLNQRFSQPQQPDPRAEQEYLSTLTTDERVNYLLHKSSQTHQSQMVQMQIAMADQNDRSEYATRCTTDKRAERYKDDVERTLGQLRSQGMNPKRETIYFYLLGQKVANGKPSAKQAEQLDVRRRRQTTQPGRAGSDAGAPRGRRGSTLEDRLADVTF